MSNERLQVLLGHLNYQTNKFGTAPTSFGSNTEDPNRFIYTLNNPKLNYHQRKFYEDNGFLVIPNLVSHEAIERWRNRFLDLIEEKEVFQRLTKMKDIALKDQKGISQERIVNKIQDFVWDEVLSEHCQLPEILDYVECFTGPNITAVHTMLINKPPDPGTRTSRHPMHQDLHYFPFRPADRIVCAWTAMERIDTENGCLFVVPGSHKGKLEQHEYPAWEKGVNKMYHGVRGFDHLPKTMLEMNKGDTVFFHPILFHGSGDNRTNRFRKAISCHYAASECYYIDVRGTTQENIADEILEVAKKRGLVGIEFKEVFKIRNRLVRGRAITM